MLVLTYNDIQSNLSKVVTFLPKISDLIIVDRWLPNSKRFEQQPHTHDISYMACDRPNQVPINAGSTLSIACRRRKDFLVLGSQVLITKLNSHVILLTVQKYIEKQWYSIPTFSDLHLSSSTKIYIGQKVRFVVQGIRVMIYCYQDHICLVCHVSYCSSLSSSIHSLDLFKSITNTYHIWCGDDVHQVSFPPHPICPNELNTCVQSHK